MRCSVSATCTRRTDCGRWSSSGGSVTAGYPRFSARPRCRRIGSCARSASAVPHVPHGTRLPGWTKQQVDAYVAGVNAFIATHHGAALPPEFSLLRFEPEPWTGLDVLVWVKMMAWDLSGNYSYELLRDDLVARRRVPNAWQQLMPPYPVDGLSIVAAGESARAVAQVRLAGTALTRPTRHPPQPARLPGTPDLPGRPAFADERLSGGPSIGSRLLLGGGRTEALGSNNWVVDGTLTASGKPLLANDPHLGTRLPSTWYLAHSSAGDFEVDRRHAAGCARRRPRPEPIHRLGRDQRRRRRAGSLSRAAGRRRDDSPSSVARRSR